MSGYVTTISVLNPSDFTVPAACEVGGSGGGLKLVDNIEQEFEEDFADDTGFTIPEPTKAEVTGGKLQSKWSNDFTIAAKWNSSINLTSAVDDVLDCITCYGGAAIVDGWMNLIGTKWVSIAPTVAKMADVRTYTYEFKFKPDFTGTAPSVQQILCEIVSENSNVSYFVFYYDLSNKFNIAAYNSSGSLIYLTTLTTIALTKDQVYDIKLVTNPTNTKLYIDTAHVGTAASMSSRGEASITEIRIGNDKTSGVDTNAFSIGNFVRKITADADGSTTIIPDNAYLETKVLLPEMEYTGAGTIKAITDIVSVIGGTPRVTVQLDRSGTFLYWGGLSYDASDESYSQAMTLAVFLLNIASLDVDGVTYIQIQAHLPDANTQSYIDNLNFEYTGEKYSQTYNEILPNSSQGMDDLENIEVSESTPTNTKFQYRIYKGAVPYWVNGSGVWSISTSASESNELAAIIAKIATFTTVGINFKIGIIPITTDGLNTPLITEIILTYNYWKAETSPSIQECMISFYVQDFVGDNYASAELRASYSKGFWHTGRFQAPFTKIATADDGETDPESKGLIRLSLIETETLGKLISFRLYYTDAFTGKTMYQANRCCSS